MSVLEKHGELLTETEAAQYLGVKPQTLRLWRSTGHIPGRREGPPYVRLGARLIRYAAADLSRWLEQRKSGGEHGEDKK